MDEKKTEGLKKLRKELYVDYLISGSITLHKWHSNAPELDVYQSSTEDTEEETHVKQQLGSQLGTMSRILRLSWKKERDTASVEVPSKQAKLTTKRGILAKLAKICDPLGLISPESLVGKLIYRTVCDSMRDWDAILSHNMARAWVK